MSVISNLGTSNVVDNLIMYRQILNFFAIRKISIELLYPPFCSHNGMSDAMTISPYKTLLIGLNI